MIDALMEEASRTVKLTDWGDDRFHEPLNRLIACFKEKYGDDPRMNFYFRNTVKSILINRLYIRDNFKTYPSILETPIKRPLFIVGLARTGSTLLHRLFAQDTACRVPRYWEMNCPFYGSILGLNHETSSISAIKLKVREIYAQYPDLFHIHEIKVDEPEECNVILRHTFCSMSIASEWHLPEYARRLVTHDMTDAYAYYRNLLQLLMWHKNGNFLALKCPSHLLNLKAILNVFPDANIVWLHRNPGKSIASYLNLLSVFWGNQAAYREFIEFIFDYSVQSVETGMDLRRDIPPSRFLDISYKELVNNPAGTMMNIYNHFGYTIGEQMVNDVQHWVTQNPRHKHGVHEYSLEKFGLTDQDVERRFSRYAETYHAFL
ncbi:MAG: sulfotransferase family protein [Candidatus Omnitrophota bacterium]